MRLLKLFTRPFAMLYAKIYPSSYAKLIGVKINGNIKIYGSALEMFSTEPFCITLGDNVHITNGVKFLTHDGGTLLFRDKFPTLDITKKIEVGNNVYIGINSIIMPGVTINDNTIIGAGSVVTKSFPSGSVVAGTPAKYIKSFDEYLEKINVESTELGHLIGNKKKEELKKYFT